MSKKTTETAAPENTAPVTAAAETAEPNAQGWPEVYVDPGTGKDKGTLYVCINGRGYYVPRGKRTRVPPEVYEVLQHRTEVLDAGDAYRDSRAQD